MQIDGLSLDCAVFVLHPARCDILGLVDGFDPARSAHCWGMVSEIKTLLSAPPIARAFDPAQALLFQMGDGAGLDRRSLAFGLRAHLPAVRLLPDPYFHRSRGFAKLRDLVAERQLAPWRKRGRTVFWRGTATGLLGAEGYRALPRVRLAAICSTLRRTDVRLYDVPEQVRSHHDPAIVAAELRRAGLMGDFVPMRVFAEHRYTIDIDGNANAWSLFEKMLLGLCILKVETPWRQWFYDRIAPWEHFVPVRADLSDLAERIEWCFLHDDAAAGIAAAAQRLALEMTYEAEMAAAARAAAAVLTPVA